MSHDSDPESDPLTVVSIGQPAHGTSALNDTTNIVTYTPDPGFIGVDNFTYVISDGQNQASSTVTVNVTDHAPVANDDHIIVYQNRTVTINSLSNDYDIDNDTLTIIEVDHPTAVGVEDAGATQISHNTIVFSLSPNFLGNVSFNYTITDGKNKNASATVWVTVIPYPIAIDDNTTTIMNQPVEIAILTNDIGVGLVIHSLEPFNSSFGGDGNVTVLFNSNMTDTPSDPNSSAAATNTTVLFIPAEGFIGVTIFTYNVSDILGTVSGQANITIEVQCLSCDLECGDVCACNGKCACNSGRTLNSDNTTCSFPPASSQNVPMIVGSSVGAAFVIAGLLFWRKRDAKKAIKKVASKLNMNAATPMAPAISSNPLYHSTEKENPLYGANLNMDLDVGPGPSNSQL